MPQAKKTARVGRKGPSQRKAKTPKSRIHRKNGIPLAFRRVFSSADPQPLENLKTAIRSTSISNSDGSVVFRKENVEVPKDWSPLATDILVTKYFRKTGVSAKAGESSVKQVISRITSTIREAGERLGYFTKKDAVTFEAELQFLLAYQYGAFNSPVWFNVGLYHRYGIKGSGGNFYYDEKLRKTRVTADAYSRPQSSACFIQSVEDDLNSIFQLGKNEARVFKYGSGTGTNFSKIRGSMETLSGGGKSSGLMSFLEVLDKGAGATKSGGTTRRAAKMVCLDIDHPEIEEFIDWKVKEEEKAAALIRAGFSGDFEGEAYRSVSGQNSNNSVRVPDSFMQAVENQKEWKTTKRTDGKVFKTYSAKNLFRKLSEAAWKCADPGIQFDTTINEWNTCAKSDRIYGSNPCSEYLFLNDSACNLASLNLSKFLNTDGSFAIDRFRQAVRVFFVAQDILISISSYPTEKIAENSLRFRPLGLGYANLGALLMELGIPYDSEMGRALCGAITALMHGEAYSTSAEMAKSLGAFRGFERNRSSMMKVMKKHLQSVKLIAPLCPNELLQAAQESLTAAYKLGEKFGYRNAQATVLAPTGTIGLLMDCDTTGIEPEYSLVKWKSLSGGGTLKIINRTVAKALARLNYSADQISAILKYCLGHQSLVDCPYLTLAALRAKGLSEQDIKNVTEQLPKVRRFSEAFNRNTISEVTLHQLGYGHQKRFQDGLSFLQDLGFSPQDIEATDQYVCGQLTLEGCPELLTEHLPIFDCANKNGKNGRRFLSATSHLKMMAAAQPFLSGGISKTVNLPEEATVQDVERIFYEGWKLGLKAIAIYRDNSKFVQPLDSGKATDPSVLREKIALDD